MTTTPDSDRDTQALTRGDWNVDPAQSKLFFRTRIMGVIPINGGYDALSGALHIDPAGGATGDLRIEATTVATGIKRRDAHLRSKDFFHTDTYPYMTFDLAGLEPATDGTAQLSGTLRIRDRDLPIDTPVTLAATGARGIRITTTAEVDPRAAGFEFKRLPRNVEIDVSVTLEPAS